MGSTQFNGFSRDFLSFFNELEANNSKEWFHANKARFEASVREPFRDFLAVVNTELAAQSVPLSADLKKSISRPNRDIRFSNDKSLYKTYIAGTLTREPGEMSPGLMYINLSPTEIFVGGGFYEVQPEELTALRRGILKKPDAWLAITRNLEKSGHPLSQENALKRMPKGFEEAVDSPVADAIRLKGFVAKMILKPKDLADPDLPQRIAVFGKTILPLIRFGWEAIKVA
jgi:uncharacterized protein (TIGR02453 family)